MNLVHGCLKDKSFEKCGEPWSLWPLSPAPLRAGEATGPRSPFLQAPIEEEKYACKGGYNLGSFVCYKFLVPLFSNLGHNTANPFKVIKDEFGKNKVIIFISVEP